MNKNIVLLWQGQLASQLGMQAYTVAMLFYLMEHTGSAALMSVLMTLSVLPAVILGPLAGVVADKLCRKHIMVAADAGRGLAVLTLAGLLFSGVAAPATMIVAFGTVAVISGTGRAFFQPASEALVPDLVSPASLPRTVAWLQSSSQVAMVAGQAAGGFAYRLLGAPVLIALDGLTYLYSAVSQLFIHTPQLAAKPATQAPQSWTQRYHQHFAMLADGIRFVRAQRGMTATLCFAASINFFIAPVMLMLPFYVTGQLQESAIWYGLLLAAMALGSIVGMALCGRYMPVPRTRWLLGAMLVLATSTASLGQVIAASSAVWLMGLAGAAMGAFNHQVMVLFQQRVPSAHRGRIMSLLMTLSASLLPAGLLSAGALGEATAHNTALLFSLSAAGMVVVTGGAAMSTALHDFISG